MDRFTGGSLETTLLPPMVAAWTAGRLINELAFHMVRAWLFVDRDSAAEVEKLCAKLALIVRQLHSDPSVQDALRDAMHGLLDRWSGMYTSEWYSDARFNANREIAARCRGDADPAQLQLEWCRQLARDPEGLIQEAWQIVEQRLDTQQQLAMRSADFVDQGVRARGFYERACTGAPLSSVAELPAAGQSGSAATAASDSAVGEDSSPQAVAASSPTEAAMGWETALGGRTDPEPIFGLPSSTAMDDHPDAGWIAELEQRWRQLVLLPVLLPSTTVEKLGEPGEALRYVTTVHVAATRALQLQSASSAGGECRLAVDSDRLVAYLDGRAYPLPSYKSALMLKAIADENGGWISLPEMKDQYEELKKARVGRTLDDLPQELSAAIESNTRGHRLRVVT